MGDSNILLFEQSLVLLNKAGNDIDRVNPNNNGEIYVMRANGSDETNRTNNPAFDFNPDWQPLDRDDDDDDEGDDDD